MSPSNTEMFPKFVINEPHKFILYFASIILFTSFFFEIKGIALKRLQIIMSILIITGLIIWYIIKLIKEITPYKIPEKHNSSDYKYYLACYSWFKVLEGIYVCISIIMFIWLIISLL